MDEADLKRHLLSKGYRLTGRRMAVLNAVLREENRHMSASQIHEEVQKEYPGIGIATVYKNLRMLEEEGIVNRLDLPNNTGYYEINREYDYHIHLICLQCGTISDFTDGSMHKICDSLHKNAGFLVKKSSMNLFGYCEECLHKRKKGGSSRENRLCSLGTSTGKGWSARAYKP